MFQLSLVPRFVVLRFVVFLLCGSLLSNILHCGYLTSLKWLYVEISCYEYVNVQTATIRII